jgi:S-methylmethionine-dependent homocysteine/selenocysteine methylase
MAKYRHDLPQMRGGTFLSDGGMETALIFLDGIDLPYFASFPLVETEDGRAALERYYESFLRLARRQGLGFVLDTPTWRASPDWGAKLGYDRDRLRSVNTLSVAFLEDLRSKWETPTTPCVINGVLGPRGDGYKAGNMDGHEAEDYHSLQIETFLRSTADMVSAVTMNTVGEALGIARGAKAFGMPCVVSFTVETDGRLVDGTTLREAIETIDERTGGSPAYYMINCAHPTHFRQALDAGQAWTTRIHGVRANASSKSHQELDDSTELDIGDIADLGRRYRELTSAFPRVRVLGGCCGTDHRHIAAICEACVPPAVLTA